MDSGRKLAPSADCNGESGQRGRRASRNCTRQREISLTKRSKVLTIVAEQWQCCAEAGGENGAAPRVSSARSLLLGASSALAVQQPQAEMVLDNLAIADKALDPAHKYFAYAEDQTASVVDRVVFRVRN